MRLRLIPGCSHIDPARQAPLLLRMPCSLALDAPSVQHLRPAGSARHEGREGGGSLLVPAIAHDMRDVHEVQRSPVVIWKGSLIIPYGFLNQGDVHIAWQRPVFLHPTTAAGAASAWQILLLCMLPAGIMAVPVRHLLPAPPIHSLHAV